MSLLDEGESRWAFLWGPISSGTAARASTAELWAEIRGQLSEAGMAGDAHLFSAVNKMRGAGAAQRVSAERFGRAPDEALFTGRHAAAEFNARPLVEQAILPRYLVRFDLTGVDGEGNLVTRTVSMRDVWRPDMTVGEVRDAVREAAEYLAEKYGLDYHSHSDLAPVTI